MFNNFKISPFVRLNLLANGKPTYISVFDIQQIYEDTSGKGQEGVRIIFPNDEYTFVEGPLDKVVYAIDEVLNPDWYKEASEEEIIKEDEEESRPKPDEIAAQAASKILKRFCTDKMCGECIFSEEHGECRLKDEYPSCWVLPKGGQRNE